MRGALSGALLFCSHAGVIGLLSIGVVSSGHAQAPFPPPAPFPGMAPRPDMAEAFPVAAGAAEVEDTSRRRDPFWPVGYVPKVVRKVESPKGNPASPAGSVREPSRAPQWEEARKKLDVRGVSLIGHEKESGQPRFVAMVTGKLVEEGDVVSVTHENKVYRWKVVGISTAGISFQKLDVRPE